MHPSQHRARARRALPAHESDPLRTTWLGARATIPHATPCGRVQPPAVHGGRRALGVVLHLGLRRRTIGCLVVAPWFFAAGDFPSSPSPRRLHRRLDSYSPPSAWPVAFLSFALVHWRLWLVPLLVRVFAHCLLVSCTNRFLCPLLAHYSPRSDLPRFRAFRLPA